MSNLILIFYTDLLRGGVFRKTPFFRRVNVLDDE